MHIITSYEKIEELASEVADICKAHSITPSLSSDLNKMLTLCSKATDIARENNSELYLDLCRAKRVLSAISTCKDDALLGEPLRRIARSVLNSSSSEPSQGKDALFELEFHEYLKVHNYRVRLGEPDIIIDTPWGEWFIACKTINSPDNFEKQLSSGCAQVVARGTGCVAFNIEPEREAQELLYLKHPAEADTILNKKLQEQIRDFRRHTLKKIRDGRLDGVIYSKSRFVHFENTNSDLDVYTVTMYSSDIANQKIDAVKRFNYVSHYLDNVINRGF